MNQLSLVACLLLCSAMAQGAFQDFVIGPESYLGDVEPPVDEEQVLDDDPEQDLMVSFQDVQRDVVVDTNLLMKALMQHANRLGMSLDDLGELESNQITYININRSLLKAGLNMGDDDEAFNSQLGCSSGQDEFNHQERPTWRDVLFN
ncbi:hypothetical protein KR038_005449 [Drosophila bunnanda]|nr:hypothetical protein KR038_005449 [Drosophila bunnanda]